jgi:cell division protein FtsB
VPTLVGMATSTIGGNEPFARIVESRKTTSWTIGIPIAVAVVVVVALLAYFAAKATQAREQLAQVQQSVQQQQQMLTSLQQRVGAYETELNRLRDPGRTTVILQAAAPKKGSAASSAWGAATWGEQTDGKSWMRLSAYGLQPPPAGKVYQLWFVALSGDSIPVGKVEPNVDGNAYLEGKDLPAVDQGKTAMVALDDPNAKTHGDPLFQAALPKLTPEQHGAPPQK